jgi:hypothetical protein
MSHLVLMARSLSALLDCSVQFDQWEAPHADPLAADSLAAGHYQGTHVPHLLAGSMINTPCQDGGWCCCRQCAAAVSTPCTPQLLHRHQPASLTGSQRLKSTSC